MDWTIFRLANISNYTIPARSIMHIRLDDLVIEVSLLGLKENRDYGRLMPKIRSGRESSGSRTGFSWFEA